MITSIFWVSRWDYYSHLHVSPGGGGAMTDDAEWRNRSSFLSFLSNAVWARLENEKVLSCPSKIHPLRLRCCLLCVENFFFKNLSIDFTRTIRLILLTLTYWCVRFLHRIAFDTYFIVCPQPKTCISMSRIVVKSSRQTLVLDSTWYSEKQLISRTDLRVPERRLWFT